MVSTTPPIVPVIPVAFAETVARKCGVELNDTPESHDLVATINRKRVGAFVSHMDRQTPYWSGAYCQSWYEFAARAGYESALHAGASPEAAFCVADELSEPAAHCRRS